MDQPMKLNLPKNEADATYFASVKYVPLQLAIIPREDRFILASAYGPHRTYMGSLSGPELLEFFASNFSHQLEAAEHEAERAAAAARAAPASLSLDLDFNLNLDL